MKTDLHKEIKNAKWVTMPDSFESGIIVRSFNADKPEKAEICISALGFFVLYLNGRRVGEDYFQPLNSLFRRRDMSGLLYPIKDEFTYRCYYSIYDITDYLQNGENTVEIALGNGWYRQTERTAEGNMSFGDALGAIYAISVDGDIIKSDGSEKCRTSATVYSQLFIGEVYDARIDKEESYVWDKVSLEELPETELTFSDVPPDRVIRRIAPKVIFSDGEKKIYDAGENISGFAALKSSAKTGEKVVMRFAEQLRNGEIDFESTGAVYKTLSGRQQIMEDAFIGDGEEHIFEPSFVWHAFRYVEVIGDGEIASVAVVHSDVEINAEFESDSKELNWIFGAFKRTQLNNMHAGVPSDCPHRERLGYTGDGQVCAPAGMIMFSSREFYKKWIRDIFDSQDKNTGHVNHTAPFAGGGGGPGGWGCAAITVPYNYYKIFGDYSVIEENYDRMKKWIYYLKEHTENGLVVREEEGGWCLGEWFTLEKAVIPEPFVNTCYFIKVLKIMEEITKSESDASEFELLSKSAQEAVKEKYYNSKTGSFAGGVQGADAFAIFAGIGDERTFKNLVKKYKELSYFDTGFLATDILCSLLFEGGEADTIYELLTSHELGSFGYMMDKDATTVWEDWKGEWSHNHPMFAACARLLVSEVLGISQSDILAGFEKVMVAPKIPRKMNWAKGGLKLPNGGEVRVKWEKARCGINFEVEVINVKDCVFEYCGAKRQLYEGTNKFCEERESVKNDTDSIK